MSPGISITTRAIQTETESEHEASEDDDDPQPQPLQQQEDTAEIAVQPSTSAPNHKAQASPQTVISTQAIGDKVGPSDWVVVRVPFDTKDKCRH